MSDYVIRGFVVEIREFVQWDDRFYVRKIDPLPVAKIRASDMLLLQAFENIKDEREAARELNALCPPSADEVALPNAAETIQAVIRNRMTAARKCREQGGDAQKELAGDDYEPLSKSNFEDVLGYDPEELLARSIAEAQESDDEDET